MDHDDWLALNNHIFAGHPENGNWTIEDLQNRMAQPWFKPGDFLILESGGRLAGFCWLKVEQRPSEGRVGEIYVIGIAPEHHGQGLGRYLLSVALAHLSKQSVDALAVYVDASNTAGVRLYESLGFHHHHVDVLYSLPLTSTSGSVPTAAATN
jgi:mycothiol synthase